MNLERENIGEMYAARALDGTEPPVSSISIPRIREARDMVYNGAPELPADASEHANEFAQPRNKKHRQRKVSPFVIVLILLGVAVLSVFYIGNILTVGRLMMQIDQMQSRHQQILNEQELLKARINRLAGLERIQQLAHDQLGLQTPQHVPMRIDIDPERAQQIEEIVRQQTEQNE